MNRRHDVAGHLIAAVAVGDGGTGSGIGLAEPIEQLRPLDHPHLQGDQKRRAAAEHSSQRRHSDSEPCRERSTEAIELSATQQLQSQHGYQHSERRQQRQQVRPMPQTAQPGARLGPGTTQAVQQPEQTQG